MFQVNIAKKVIERDFLKQINQIFKNNKKQFEILTLLLFFYLLYQFKKFIELFKLNKLCNFNELFFENDK